MTNDDHIFIWVTLHELLQGLNGFGIEGIDREVVISHLLLGKTMPFEIVSDQSSEVLNFFCKSGKAQCRMASSVDAEEKGSFFACS